MARKPEEVEAAIELARAAGVSEALLERMGGYTGCVGVLDTGRPATTNSRSRQGRRLRPPLRQESKAIGKAPFYVSEMSPKVHHCMGGMATNVATAVLDVETDQPIPGLFAAGEFVGGIHGAVMDCLVNGRQAGLSAAKDKL